MDDLVKRLRDFEQWMREPADKEFTLTSDLFDDAASRIEKLETALREINKRLNDKDSWLAQSIDCRNIAEFALGEKKDGN
jgi:hypothetical protein